MSIGEKMIDGSAIIRTIWGRIALWSAVATTVVQVGSFGIIVDGASSQLMAQLTIAQSVRL
jgi:hypothetical protein